MNFKNIKFFFQTFDGAKLFLPKKYDSQVMEAKHSQSGEKVAVHLSYKKQLEMLDRDMIQQLNIIFKRIFNVLKFKMVITALLRVTFIISIYYVLFPHF